MKIGFKDGKQNKAKKYLSVGNTHDIMSKGKIGSKTLEYATFWISIIIRNFHISFRSPNTNKLVYS